MRKIALSIRKLVHFILRSGDIDSSFSDVNQAIQGIRLHQKVQNTYPANYKKEVPLQIEIEYEAFSYVIEGRADGMGEIEGRLVIEEIKSTLYKEEQLRNQPNPLHWAQLKCYGYIACVENHLPAIDLKLTYIHRKTEEIFSFEEEFSFQILEDFVFSLLKRYSLLAALTVTFEDEALCTARELSFPFPHFRRYQRELSVSNYNMIQKRGVLLAEAPTGIGKTMATVFSSIKAIGEGKIERIFYAVGKSTQKNLPLEAHRILKRGGLRLKSLELTAKDKICLNDKVNCNPEDCPYARGHYDRIFSAILDIYEKEDSFHRESISQYSEKHTVCPFEFQLDLVELSQLIIGDYNYIFHPISYLQRFLVDRKTINKTHLLIDEAHNLIDRGRDMYSVSFPKVALLKFLELDHLPSQMKKIAETMLRTFPTGPYGLKIEAPIEWNEYVWNLQLEMESALSEGREFEEDFFVFYFLILDYLSKTKLFHDDYFTYYLGHESIHIHCINPSSMLERRRSLFHSALYFSATLTPFSYHALLSGAGKEASFLSLPSPFEPEHLLILHPQNIATTYRHRSHSRKQISSYLQIVTEAYPGNYLFFFPSYEYLEQVYEVTSKWDMGAIRQNREMTEEERAAFIEKFFSEKNIHGYVVLGGVFSEGIDLVGDALEGACIITIGLPSISRERNLIKEKIDERGLIGYDYAYTIPGLIKVMQAAGRIIRREEDRGVLLLIDQRYNDSAIRSILPSYWQIQNIQSEEDMVKALHKFKEEI